MRRYRYLAIRSPTAGALTIVAFLPVLAAGRMPVRAAESPVARGKLVTTGPDTMEAMTKSWITAFKKRHPEADVSFVLKDCHPEDRIAAGPDVDEVFANTSAPFCEKYGYEPFKVKVSLGGFDTPGRIQALGVFVHPTNPIRKLTLAQLDAIYSDERRRGHSKDVSTWGDVGLGGEWAKKPIHAYGRKLSNEVAWFFKDVVTFDGAYKASYIQPGKAASVDVMNALADDASGIGYSGFAYRTDKVKAIALADRDGVYREPSRTDVESGRYPLVRPLYIYINRAPGTDLDALTRQFLAFVLSKEGQQAGSVEGMLPLPPAMAATEEAKLQ
jgi:phosphate transport system substrate-binding protein